MKRKCTLFIGLIALALVSCSKRDQLVVDPDNPLIGTWVMADGASAAVTYKRASRLKDDGYGLVFHADGKLVKREIAGWCATPPVSYANNEGKWRLIDGNISTTMHYLWLPEEVTQSWKIVSVDAGTLVVEYQ